ncbi:MAG: hypothetical protein NTX28_07140 [Novosphingobium sp.]|nr:hypothetical protein [Novosphingobium sp.]
MVVATSSWDGKAEVPRGRDLPMGRFLLLAGLTFAALFLGSLLLPSSSYIRYQQLSETIHFRTVWAYERIVFDPTPIDVALIGNSRLGAGVSAPALSAGLSAKLGREVRVVNFSMPQDGRNAHFALTKLLLQHHPEVKLIVLDIIEQSARKGHPAFRNIADVNDVLKSPLLINLNEADDITYLPYRQITTALATWFPEVSGYRNAFDPASYTGSTMETTTSFRQVTGAWIDRDTIFPRAKIDASAAIFRNGMTPPVLPNAMRPFEFVMPLQYTTRIADLAKQHQASVAFLYLPVFELQPNKNDWIFYRDIGPILDAGFLRSDFRNYSDGGHLNRFGVKRLTPWLIDELSNLPAIRTSRQRGASSR